MKRVVFACVAAWVTCVASAAMPAFVATCPTDINVDSGRTGVVYVNGQKATVKKVNENNYDAKAGKKGDLFKIQAGNERYEIPEAVVFGG